MKILFSSGCSQFEALHRVVQRLKAAYFAKYGYAFPLSGNNDDHVIGDHIDDNCVVVLVMLLMVMSMTVHGNDDGHDKTKDDHSNGNNNDDDNSVVV